LQLTCTLFWPQRNQNSPGEDAFTNGEYGAYIVRGAQGALFNGTYPHGEYRKVLREMKHFTAYSVEAGRNSAPDDWNITLKDLDEYYFVPLRACVTKADVGAFMCTATPTSFWDPFLYLAHFSASHHLARAV